MSVDFFPPRFENPCDYTMILVRFSRHLVKHNIIPLELVREILMRMRDNFLNELEIEVMRGDNLPRTELVREVEVKRVINRSISVKAMMNLIHTIIIYNQCLIMLLINKIFLKNYLNTMEEIHWYSSIKQKYVIQGEYLENIKKPRSILIYWILNWHLNLLKIIK